MNQALVQTSLPGLPVRRGKVRDIYDLGDQLLLVSTDRISAFDWVLPTGIPDKGRVLTQISQFWFEQLHTSHHVITTELDRWASAERHGRGGPGGPQHAGAQMPGRAGRMCRARLPGRVRLEGVSAVGHGVRHCAAGRTAAMFAAGGADLHAGHEGGNRPRHQHLLRADDWDHGCGGGRGTAAAEH